MVADIIVGAVVLVSALISFLRGFIRETLTIIGVVGGLLAALMLGPKFTPIVNGWYGIEPDMEDMPKLFDLIPMDWISMATAYGLIFIIVVALISLASHFLAAGAKAAGLGPVDRTLGVIFGIARAVLLLGLLYLPFHNMMGEETKTELFGESRTHIYVEKTSEVIANAVVGFLPGDGEMKKTVEDSFKKNLIEQELLKRQGGEEQSAPAQTPEEGYQDDQRDDMDKLFQEPRYND
ncbi:MAG: CvpA family protein [Pseudomonadota bacterium]